MSFFLTLLVFAAIFVLGEILRPKQNQEDAKPAGLGDFQFPTATEGRSVPLVWGTVQIKGPNVVWYDDLSQFGLTTKIKTGLFSSKRIVTGFQYRVGIQFALCRGPGVVLKEVWVGDESIFSGTVSHLGSFTKTDNNFFGGNDLGNGGLDATMKFFAGEATQPVSTYLSAFQLEGTKTPAYRGTCYLAPDTVAPYIGNSSTIKPWRFSVQRIPNGLGLTGGNENVNAGDANPMNVIYEIMTDTDWGLGFPVTDIDTTDFTTAATTLKTEGNGFSMLLDSPIEAADLIRLVEEQIDGVVFYNQQTAKWQINLARFDYNIDTVPQITAANLVEIKDFGRGSWEDTTNQIRVQYVDKQDEFKITFALAQDMANIRLQDGANVTAEKNYPGCKDRVLANQLAWRDLRTVSLPLAKGTLVTDRTMWDRQPAEVIAFTDPDMNFTKLPMRVQAVDLGELVDNRVTLSLVQDTFLFQVGAFADPGGTGWTPPLDVLVAFPTAQQIAFEVPRALVTRDPEFTGTYTNKVWAGARRVGNASSFLIVERHVASPSTPSGAFLETGEVFAFLLIGQLNANLDAGSAIPLSSITITATPDTKEAIEAEFGDGLALSDVGTGLLNMVLVDNEFMLAAGGASINGANVDLNSVYRGALDSVQADHTSGTNVYLVFVGGGLSDGTFTDDDNVHIKLLPKSITDTLAEASATQIAITPIDKRILRPYPVASVTLNTVLFDKTAVSLEGTGSGGEDFGILTDIIRRDFRTGDETASLLTDAQTLDTSYPAANNTTHEIDVRNDPAGANTFLFTETYTGKTDTILRIKILKALDDVLPTNLRYVIRAKHDEGAETALPSRQELTHDFAVVTALTGDFNFGARDVNVISKVYTATVAGTYNFTLSSAFGTTGDVESRVNGGSFTVLIAQGGTTGAIAGIVATDTIEIRHTSTTADELKFITMAAAGAGQDGFGVLFT